MSQDCDFENADIAVTELKEGKGCKTRVTESVYWEVGEFPFQRAWAEAKRRQLDLWLSADVNSLQFPSWKYVGSANTKAEGFVCGKNMICPGFV